MKPFIVTLAVSVLLLAGCVSHDGTYSPACIAYAGSKITLSDGEFVWEKFTDEVVVNDAGETVDRFPGYPMRGTYRIYGQRVLMESSDGEAIEDDETPYDETVVARYKVAVAVLGTVSGLAILGLLFMAIL